MKKEHINYVCKSMEKQDATPTNSWWNAETYDIFHCDNFWCFCNIIWGAFELKNDVKPGASEISFEGELAAMAGKGDNLEGAERNTRSFWSHELSQRLSWLEMQISAHLICMQCMSVKFFEIYHLVNSGYFLCIHLAFSHFRDF